MASAYIKYKISTYYYAFTELLPSFLLVFVLGWEYNNYISYWNVVLYYL